MCTRLKIAGAAFAIGHAARAAGANPVSMPAPEICGARQTGVPDGAMIDASTLGAFKLAEVTGCIKTGMDTTISDAFPVMHRDVFDSLDQTAQTALADDQAAQDVALAPYSAA